MPGDPLRTLFRLPFRLLHRAGAKLVDDASFGTINALHLRHSGGPGFAARLREYIAGWEGREFADYYRIDGPGVDPARNALAALPAPDPRRETRVRFPSPLPSHAEADAYENDHAVYDLFPATAHGAWEKAPTLLMAHGLMSVSDIGYRRQAAKLNGLGWNVVFLHLPYHYARKPRAQWGRVSSGELAVTADLVRTVEGVRQSVVETRLLVEWLSGHGAPFFAGWGTSYGAWIMALLGCVEERMGRLVLVEPILDIQAAIWESPACAAMRWHLGRHGVTPGGTAPHLRLCCPLHVPPRLDPRHVLLLAGTYDRIAPPETIRALHRKWEGSHFYEFPQGHVGYRLLPESFRLAKELWGADLPPLD